MDTKRCFVFDTPTVLSELDLLSMGGSVKHGDDSKIGQFNTGLKYAIAILLRMDVQFSIEVLNDKDSEPAKYTFEVLSRYLDGKTMDTIVFDKNTYKRRTYMNISPSLGYQWEDWMALRELYSNTLDESGYCYDTQEVNLIPLEKGTRFILEINTKLEKCLNRWDEYFIDNSLSVLGGDSGINVDKLNPIKVLRIPGNKPKTLKIFKQGILIYESDQVSNFWYNISFGELDEKRQALAPWELKCDIKDGFYRIKDEQVFQEFFEEVDFNEDSFETGFDLNTSEDLFVERLQDFIDSSSDNLPIKLLKNLASNKYIKVNAHNLSGSLGIPSYLSSETLVTKIAEEPEKEEEKTILDLAKSIVKSLNLPIEMQVKQGQFTYHKALANMSEKSVIIATDFTEEDKFRLIKACYKIAFEDNIDKIFQYITKTFY